MLYCGFPNAVNTNISMGFCPILSKIVSIKVLTICENILPLANHRVHTKTSQIGWSESSLDINVVCWFCPEAIHNSYLPEYNTNKPMKPRVSQSCIDTQYCFKITFSGFHMIASCDTSLQQTNKWAIFGQTYSMPYIKYREV